MRIAALIKQVPAFEAMELGPDGRLVRDGLELELNPYCRRAVAKGVELAQLTGGTCTAITLGPPAAEDSLREAVAWGCDDGVLVTGAAFAGSDTLATSKALAAALTAAGPFDLVLVGRNSVDADTGQVGPQVAELIGLPFASGVRVLSIEGDAAQVQCEEDDGYSERTVRLPAVLSCAERLCEPAKVKPEGRAAVDADRIRTLAPDDLGAGPWGQDASGTYVGETRTFEVARDHQQLAGDVSQQVADAVRLLDARGALSAADDGIALEPVGAVAGGDGPTIAVVVEPNRANLARELLGAANRLAREIEGNVVAITSQDAPPTGELSAWGADGQVAISADAVEEDVASALATWARAEPPWAVLLPSTAWGREVGGRVAAALGAGLTGDAVELEVSTVASTGEQQLLAWKPAFGGQLVAAIYCSTPVQMATVRPGTLPAPPPRASSALPCTQVTATRRGRVVVHSSVRDDDVDVLAQAKVVIGVGAGVPPDEYEAIEELAEVLDAQIAATRKVTDKAWLPRARQIGITGRSIAPRLYVAVGLSGKFNHAVGVRAAVTILAINDDPTAPIWDHADIGIIGNWREVVPALTNALAARA